MKNIAKIISIFAVFAFTLMAKPAHAFYLEVPQSVKNLFTILLSSQTFAQEGSTITPPPPTGSTEPMPPQGTQPSPMPPSGDQTGMMPPPPPSGDQYRQPGTYDPNQQQGMQGNYQGMPYGDQQGQGMQGGQDGARQLAEMKRNMKQMGRMVKQFEQMIASAEKKGTVVPEEIKQKLAKLKGILDAVQNAKTSEELQDVDMSEIQDLTQSLEDYRRNVMEGQQRLDGMKRGMRGMEQGLKMFKTQIARLTKQKIAVPTEVTDNIAKLEAIITTIKTAKTAEEMDAIDFESMQDLMESMDQNRQQLEILARWPQTLKQIDRQMVQLTSALKRSKSIVDGLAKKGVDLQAEYTAFAEAVNKLKSVRDDAVAKMAAGDSEGAFSALEDDFFGQMDDVWQNQKVIMTMSNLGRFSSEFKRGMSQANATIKMLKRKKIDTADLEAIMAQANEKGQEVINLLKAKPIDVDAVTDALDGLENVKQEFEAKVSELTGDEDELPWEQGPQQFRDINLPQGFDKFVPQKQPAPTSQPTESSSQLPL